MKNFKFPSGPYKVEKSKEPWGQLYIVDSFPLAPDPYAIVIKDNPDSESLANLFADAPQAMLLLQNLVNVYRKNRSKSAFKYFALEAEKLLEKHYENRNANPANSKNV